MYNPISAIRLSLRAVFGLTIIFVGLLAVFLTIAWLTNSLKLPAFLLPSRNTPLSLVVDVMPKDSAIVLNDEPYDSNRNPLPGDYTIKITRNGYLPVEEEIRIHPNQKNQFTFHLVPIPTIVLIARDVDFPGWDQQSDLFFLDLPENKIFKLSGGKSAPMVNLDREVYQLLYLPSGARVVALMGEGPEGGSLLQMFDIETGKISALEGTGFASLGPDGEIIWGFNYDTTTNIEKPVWMLQQGGKVELISLENSQWATYGDQLLLDASNQWLAIEGSRGVAVWEIASGKLLATFESASAPVWVQNPHSGLAYLGSDHILYFASEESDWNSVVLLSGVASPIAAVPGGSEIIFTRYNPFAGGSSFWAVDTATMGARLLSEARTESGRAEQIAISLDGKKLAFINDKSVLYLVVLEP